MDTLTILEESQLAKCERAIEKGLRSFVDVGNALLEIRESRLYRAEFETFEAYCATKWKLKRQRAYELMEATEITERLSEISDTKPKESHAAKLKPLPPEEQPAAWQEAVDTAPEGKPTAKHVAEVVARRIAETKVEPEPEPEAEDIDDSADIEFDDEGRIVEDAPPPAEQDTALRRSINSFQDKFVIARWLFDSCTESQRAHISVLWSEWWKES